MSEDEVREALRKATEKAGGQRAFAKLHGFSPAYVNDVLLGRRWPAEKICAALGITRKVIYEIEYKRRKP